MVSQKIPLAVSYTTPRRNKSSSLRCDETQRPGHAYKYILTGIDVASRYKFARPFKTKNPTKLAFVLEAV